MSPFQVMLLTHCFAAENSYKQTVVEASVGGTNLSSQTITECFFKYHVFCTDGKISVRINLPLFSTVVPSSRWDDRGK